MFGLEALRESMDNMNAALAEHGKVVQEVHDVMERLHTHSRSNAIDFNRRLATIESDRAQVQGMRAALAAYEESHATYTEHSVNGFPVKERHPHQCELCVAARKFL